MARRYYNAGAAGRDYSALKFLRPTLYPGRVLVSFAVVTDPNGLSSKESRDVALNEEQVRDLHAKLGDLIAAYGTAEAPAPMIEGEI